MLGYKAALHNKTRLVQAHDAPLPVLHTTDDMTAFSVEE